MSIKEAVARGYNFFVVTFLGIVAGVLVGEVPEEGIWQFRIDELLVIAIGIAAVVWYLTGQHRYQRSLVLLALAAAAVLAKVLGVIIEFKAVLEVGDDYTVVQALLFLVIVAGVAYYRTRTPEALDVPSTREESQVPARMER
jgi:hypothetical protein